MQQGKREKVNVLFVCTGNTCRSPMAEQIFSEYLRRNKCASMADVSSAGVFADNNRPMQPEAVGHRFHVERPRDDVDVLSAEPAAQRRQQGKQEPQPPEKGRGHKRNI